MKLKQYDFKAPLEDRLSRWGKRCPYIYSVDVYVYALENISMCLMYSLEGYEA